MHGVITLESGYRLMVFTLRLGSLTDNRTVVGVIADLQGSSSLYREPRAGDGGELQKLRNAKFIRRGDFGWQLSPANAVLLLRLLCKSRAGSPPHSVLRRLPICVEWCMRQCSRDQSGALPHECSIVKQCIALKHRYYLGHSDCPSSQSQYDPFISVESNIL